MKKRRLPELLAPAGSYDALLAAVEGGADAVYLGAQGFNARASADNFDTDTLVRAIDYCHAHGVHVYVTLNTLLYDRELPAFLALAKQVAAAGADAAIVADVGAMALLRRELPTLPIHASTQASAHSADGVRTLAAFGAVRCVVARELSADSLARLVAASPVEIEVFVHGALCVCHSGQCLYSSLVGGRSGNRGECAQPCRLPYNGNTYPLSLQDLSLAAHIPALIDMGVSSLKIEGRMKSPAYVYHVCRIFRRLFDEGRGATKEEMRELSAVFSRGGLTDGYFTGNHRAPMTGTRSEADKAETRLLDAAYTPKKTPVPLSAALVLKKEAPARLTLKIKERDTEATVEGDVPTEARTQATDAARAFAQLARLGDTPFSLAEEDFTADFEGGLFVAPSLLNRLRREAVCGLLEKKAPAVLPPPEASTEKKAGEEKSGHRVAVVERRVQYDALCAYYEKCAPRLETPAFSPDGLPHAHGIGRQAGGFDLVFLSFLSFIEEGIPEGARLPDGVVIPPVVTDGERAEVLSHLKRIRQAGVRYALVDNIGALSLAREALFIPYGGMRLNVTNGEALARWQAEGLAGVILSPELSLPQARDLAGGTLPVYGYLPLMLTERCFIREVAGCDRCGQATLTDRRGVSFRMMRVWPHRNVILNSRPLYLFDKHKEMREAGVRGGAVFFTAEDASRTEKVLSLRAAKAAPDTEVRRFKSGK